MSRASSAASMSSGDGPGEGDGGFIGYRYERAGLGISREFVTLKDLAAAVEFPMDSKTHGHPAGFGRGPANRQILRPRSLLGGFPGPEDGNANGND